jgi:hypothetical protein
MNRRDFFKSAGRNALLLSFTALGIVGVRRGRIKQRSEGDCPLTSTCRGCERLENCRRPEAVSWRENKVDAAAKRLPEARQ